MRGFEKKSIIFKAVIEMAPVFREFGLKMTVFLVMIVENCAPWKRRPGHESPRCPRPLDTQLF